MSRNLSINSYVGPCAIAIYGKFYLCCFTISDFFLACKLHRSDLQRMHYVLEVSRYTNIFYIGVYWVLTWIERLVSTVCYFLSYFFWSVNYMSRVSKFHNFFFFEMLRNRVKMYISGLYLLPNLTSSTLGVLIDKILSANVPIKSLRKKEGKTLVLSQE